MSNENVIMKGKLFGDPYSTLDLWEFRKELTQKSVYQNDRKMRIGKSLTAINRN